VHNAGSPKSQQQSDWRCRAREASSFVAWSSLDSKSVCSCCATVSCASHGNQFVTRLEGSPGMADKIAEIEQGIALKEHTSFQESFLVKLLSSSRLGASS
jgi:hypothetical protein